MIITTSLREGLRLAGASAAVTVLEAHHVGKLRRGHFDDTHIGEGDKPVNRSGRDAAHLARAEVDGLQAICVAIGTEEFIRSRLVVMRESGLYQRRKNPIAQLKGVHFSLREQRSTAVVF